MYIYLTCTAHGKPVWTTNDADCPDRGVNNPPPVKVIGPFDDTMDEENLKESVCYYGVDLDNPSTWMDKENWIDEYLGTPQKGWLK